MQLSENILRCIILKADHVALKDIEAMQPQQPVAMVAGLDPIDYFVSTIVLPPLIARRTSCTPFIRFIPKLPWRFLDHGRRTGRKLMVWSLPCPA